MNIDDIIKIRVATRAPTTTPFADSIAFATAILEARELAGWVVVDKNGATVRSIPLKDYAPLSATTIKNYTPDELVVEYMDREHSNYAPHTLRKIYF